MGERRIINGAIYEKTPNGIVLIGPAVMPSAAPSAVPLPVNPVKAAKEARDEARKDEDQQLQRDAALRTAAAANRQAGAQESTARNQGIDNAMKLRSAYESTPIVKEYRVGITQLGAALNRPADATGDNALIYDYAKAMDPGSVVRESEMGMAASGAPAYEAAAANLKKQFKIEGGGQLTPETREKLKREIATKVGAMNKQYSAQRVRYAKDAEAFGIDPRSITGDHDGDVFMPQIKEYQDRQKGDAPDKQAVASGPTRRVYDERLQSKIDSLISAGKFETANMALRKAGKAPITPSERTKIQQWQKANPGVAYNASQFGRDVPMNLLQRAAGSDVGAGVAQAANAATAGLVGLAAGSKGQGALDAMAANSPNASVAGQVVGGVAGALGAEAAIAARLAGRGAAWLPAVLGDTTYGGLSGFNAAQEGEGLKGAALGAGAGFAGGRIGAGIANQAGRAVRGVRDPDVQYLRGRGVPLTVGQTIGNSGRLGQVVDGVEEAMTSIPGVGNMVDARRMDGLTAWNRAMLQDAAAPGAQITATGAEGLAQVRQSVGNAYDTALNPARIDINDPQYVADVAAARAAAQAIPNVQPTMPSDFSQASLANRLGAANPAGQLTGRDFQEAYRGLARDARGRVNGDYGHEVGQVARRGQEALADVLERQNPGAFDGFLEANAANRRANVVAQAMNPNAVDELVTPAQLGRADFNSTSRLTNRVNAASGNRPFYDLTSAGQSVLPSKLPDSGTAKRAIVGALTTGTLGGGGAFFGGSEGAAAGTGGGVLLAALLAAGGTRGGQRMLTSALADRPELAVELGQALSRNARLGGVAGASALTPFAIGQ